MKLEIDINEKEFGDDIANHFQDFFKRLQTEIKYRLISNETLVCGAYELETVEMFLKAFKNVTLEQEPEDAISREDVYNVLERHWLNGTVARRIVNELRESIKSLPSVQPKVKAGHWELSYRDAGIEFYMCDRCKKGRAVIDGDYELSEFNFCPNCGADMREP